MQAISKQFLALLLPFSLILSLVSCPADAANLRRPVWAGRFYEADVAELTRNIDRLTRKAAKTRVRIPHYKQLKAIIMPHAGYIYSGLTAAHAAHVLPADKFAKVILLGPDHRIGIRNAAICDVAAFETPLGNIKLHQDTAKLLLQPQLFQSLPVSRDREHSLEVILPFLQRYLVDFRLVPIIVGQGQVRQLSEALNQIIDGDSLLVISSDLSHFLSYPEAIARDRETIDEILNLKPDKLIRTDNRACGKMPILILTDLARRHRWQPVLLHYSNSGDTAGDRTRVVGYATIAFFGDLIMEKPTDSSVIFSPAQGSILIKLARRAIADKLGCTAPDLSSIDLSSASQDSVFQLHCGTFVTLKIKGQLRGCIGNLTSSDSVWDGVKLNAVNAAFHDPRFTPLSKDELDQVEVEVSILSEPQTLNYIDGHDLINKLRAHVDGVIIRKGHASATFLPQVWDQLPETEQFLTHLCRKAGLSADAWKKSEVEVLTYQVQYFEEDQ